MEDESQRLIGPRTSVLSNNPTSEIYVPSGREHPASLESADISLSCTLPRPLWPITLDGGADYADQLLLDSFLCETEADAGRNTTYEGKRSTKCRMPDGGKRPDFIFEGYTYRPARDRVIGLRSDEGCEIVAMSVAISSTPRTMDDQNAVPGDVDEIRKQASAFIINDPKSDGGRSHWVQWRLTDPSEAPTLLVLTADRLYPVRKSVRAGIKALGTSLAGRMHVGTDKGDR